MSFCTPFDLSTPPVRAWPWWPWLLTSWPQCNHYYLQLLCEVCGALQQIWTFYDLSFSISPFTNQAAADGRTQASFGIVDHCRVNAASVRHLTVDTFVQTPTNDSAPLCYGGCPHYLMAFSDRAKGI